MNKMSKAPVRFEGSIEALFDEHVVPNLPSPEVVSAFHATLAKYTVQRDPLFLLRAVSTTTRREIYKSGDGTRFRATDNAPVWWTHYQLYQDRRFTIVEFEEAIETIPTHLFDIARSIPESANTYDWHFAHIYDVKDRQAKWLDWTRADVVRRFVRNIHPCNYFLVPKTQWQGWGGDSRVLGFMRSRYRERYADVWSEFVGMAGHLDSAPFADLESFTYVIDAQVAASPKDRVAVAPRPSGVLLQSADDGVAAQYSASRFLFRADVIEALGPGQRFPD